MDIHCPTCEKPFTVSEEHYNQEVSCPFCHQSLFLEDQAESSRDEIVSTVSEELQPSTTTEVQQETGHQEPMGNKVASVLSKIIGGVFIGFAVLYAFEALMILFSGLPPGLVSSLDELPDPEWAKRGAYFAAIIRPLVLGFLGWLFFFLARKKNQPKTSPQSSRPDEQLANLSDPLQPTPDSFGYFKKGVNEATRLLTEIKNKISKITDSALADETENKNSQLADNTLSRLKPYFKSSLIIILGISIGLWLLSPTQLPEVDIWTAAGSQGNIRVVKQHLAYGTHVDSVRTDKQTTIGTTPLLEAIRFDRFSICKLLISKGADLSSKDNSGYTPFHRAAGWGRTEIASLFIAAGADVNEKTDGGTTPLHMAQNKEIAELLLSKGADIDDRSLYKAASDGRKEVAEVLIAKGADVNRMYGNSTPLDAAMDINQYAEFKRKAAKRQIAILLRKHGGKTSEELKAEGK